MKERRNSTAVNIYIWLPKKQSESKPMKAHLIFVAIFSLSLPQIALSQDLLESIRHLSAFEKAEMAFDPVNYLTVSDQAIRAWNMATADEKIRFGTNMFLVHFRRAQIMAASDNYKAAAGELIEEAKMQKAFDGRLEFSTKSPNEFFRNLVELQAQVAAETGSDPLENQVGYSFKKDADGFTASRLELSDDIAGITVPDIGNEEALALVYYINQQGDKFVISATKWLVVPKGSLPETLKKASREVKFDSTGKMVVSLLQTQTERLPEVTSPKATTQSSNTINLGTTQKTTLTPKSLETKQATVSSETTSSTLLPLVAVLIIAAIGLFWLFLMKRK